MLRFASARTPGSKRRSPLLIAASISMAPTTRSSEALIGSSTTRMRRRARGKVATHVEGIGTVEARHAISRIPRLAAEVAGRVDHHRANTLLLDLAGHALGFEQRLLAEETDVAATVADQHQ